MAINRERPITRGTRQNLISGVRSRPMSAEAVDASLEQAVQLATEFIELYETHIAVGEVGERSSARASEDPILANRAPTALLYGRVQSGKTAAMILTSALCLDNGFRVIVVLTADNVALVRQTANRFKDLDGPRVFSSVKEDGYEWEGQEEEIREDVARDGLVLVCAKDAFHLPQIIRFLQQIEGPSFPALVFDDEADAATPDTTLAARSAGRPNAPLFASTINRRVIENRRPGEEGESIGEVFSHRLYVQVTATPFVLFLQRADSDIRPDKTFLLEAGEGYCGGEVFFGAFDPTSNDAPAPPIVFVPPNEALAINRRPVPAGLRASVEFFLLASAAAAADRGDWPAEGYKHLSHSSPRVDQHTVVAAHIERHLHEVRRELRDNPDASRTRFGTAYRELQKTVPGVAALDMLLVPMAEIIRQADVHRINSETDIPSYGPRVNFLVGGNILGRGLTIDDLLVTYYVREAQVSQMDTVWQHARMYGYRESLLRFTRVYLPPRVAARFQSIHKSEVYLRDLLRRESEGENVPIRIALGTRATRPNATEAAALSVIRAGEAQLHPVQLFEEPTVAARIRNLLLENDVPLGDVDRDSRSTPIPIDCALDIIDTVPLRDDDSGTWQPQVMAAIIESYREELDRRIMVYVRGLRADAEQARTRGRLGGPEIDIIRAAAGNAPALVLLYMGDKDAPRGWYPTLVMPQNSPPFIYNPG